MNIKPVIPSATYAPSAAKETSEEERRKEREDNPKKKKFALPAKEEASAIIDPSAEQEAERDKLMPQSEKVIEWLSQRQQSPLPSSAPNRFSQVAKVKSLPEPENSKLNKKY